MAETVWVAALLAAHRRYIQYTLPPSSLALSTKRRGEEWDEEEEEEEKKKEEEENVFWPSSEEEGRRGRKKAAVQAAFLLSSSSSSSYRLYFSISVYFCLGEGGRGVLMRQASLPAACVCVCVGPIIHLRTTLDFSIAGLKKKRSKTTTGASHKLE